ncbi:MAG TPA: hypothetical protein VMG36_07360 [Thermoplasmata archaeon]|nr:hypothetical protein [Thermoplasmata archaeon]
MVLVAVSVGLAAFYLETRAGGSTGVQVNGAALVSDFTNAPAGSAPTIPFDYYFAWFNATSESPSVSSIHAPAGSLVRLSLVIVDDLFSGPGVPVNCSVNGVRSVAPFAIASLEGQFRSAAWLSQPFPLNFSGETLVSNFPADLDLNVTLPAQSGSYTPTFVLAISCEQFA